MILMFVSLFWQVLFIINLINNLDLKLFNSINWGLNFPTEETTENMKKGRQVWEVDMEQGPISQDLTDTKIARGNMQTGTQFS